MDALLKDLRYGARMLRKTPGASLTAALALALGIGLTTLMFSIVYAVLIRGLPFDDSQELVWVDRTNPSQGVQRDALTVHDYADVVAQARSFEEVGGLTWASFNIASGTADPERVRGALMTPSAFRVLGVNAAVGRLYTDEEAVPGGPPVIVLGWGLYQRSFGGDPGAIGRTVRVNGSEATIVGVMPRGFAFPDSEHAWMPLRPDPVRTVRGEGPPVRTIARLNGSATVEAARTEVVAIAARLAREHPATNENVSAAVRPFDEARLGVEERTLLYTMFGAVVFVLLIACMNVANLLIGRAMVRTREIGVRTALGASRWRIVTQFLAEAFALALAGAAAGTLLAWAGLRAFNAAVVDTSPPYWLHIALDAPALAWTFVATVLAAVAAGGIPAWQAARANTGDVLRDEARGSTSFRLGPMSRVLVAGEIALSVGLLVGAGLTIRSVVNVHTVDLGFDASRLFTARVSLNDSAYDGGAARLRFADELLTSASALPGVEEAALTTSAPGTGTGWSAFGLEGATYANPQDYPTAPSITVTPGFFSLVGAAASSGRTFTAQDREGSLPVAVVNESFARRFFPDQQAVGKRLRLGRADSEQPWLTIVGVVPDRRVDGIDDDDPHGIYRPLAQAPASSLTVLARTRAEPVTLTPAVREAVRALDDDLPLFDVGSLRSVIEADNWHYGVFGSLFVAFGAAALFLASVGLYGVMSFSVSRRRREMGVRMAMGATTRDVLGLVFRQGMRQTLIGLAIGTAFALAVSRLLAVVLYDVQPRDPLVFGTILVVLAGTAALACWVPAARAARVDPLEAIRQD